MFSDEERDIYVEYALLNEETLRISINTTLAFDQLRKNIITAFLKSVEKAIRERLSEEWIIDNSLLENVFDHWRGIFISKKDWIKEYQIGFSSEKYGAKGFIIGVTKASESVPHIVGLLEKMNRDYRQGTQSNNWNWYQWMEHPYQNWDNEDILIKMYRGEAVDYCVKHIMLISEIASKQIDLHMRSKADQHEGNVPK